MLIHRFAATSAALLIFAALPTAQAQQQTAGTKAKSSDAACCPAPANGVKTAKRDACAVPMTITLVGLHCAGCEGGVTKALMAVKGVEEVSVSAKTQQAVVWVCPHKNVPSSALTAAVKKAGYSVVKIAKGAPKPAAATKAAAKTAKG